MAEQLGLNIGAQEGMKLSSDHAESAQPGWGDRALLLLERYCREVGGRFIAPTVRSWAYSRGLERPPTNFAWGSVFYRAPRAGLIIPDGYTQHGDGTMHTQSVRVWKAT